MNPIKYAVLLVLGLATLAQAKPICEMSSEDFQAKAQLRESLTGFRNSPGPLRTGICWWHSRLQRSAIYLATFDKPNSPVPTFPELLDLLREITRKRSVVTIPGYRDWNEFSLARTDEIRFFLDQWYLKDATEMEFLKGAKFNLGTSYSSMLKIDREVNLFKRLPYVLVDLPLGSAHAWIITNYNVNDQTMNLIDSNRANWIIQYDIKSNAYGNFEPGWTYAVEFSRSAPTDLANGRYSTRYFSADQIMSLHVQNEGDYADNARAISSHCRKETPFTQFEARIKSFKRKELLKTFVGQIQKESDL